MTTIVSSRNLLQVAGEWPTIKLTAEFHVEGGTIKRISSGNILSKSEGRDIHIGSFSAEESGSININLYTGGMDNLEAVCTALPALILDVKSQLEQ